MLRCCIACLGVVKLKFNASTFLTWYTCLLSSPSLSLSLHRYMPPVCYRENRAHIAGVVAFYMTVSLSLVFLNKIMMSGAFPFPIFLTWVQLIVAVGLLVVISAFSQRYAYDLLLLTLASFTYSFTYTHTLSLSLPHTHTHSLTHFALAPLTLIHTHTHTHTHSLTHSRTHSLSLSVGCVFAVVK
jgi:hypothetical protein